MPRRALAALITTAAAIALLASFKTPGQSAAPVATVPRGAYAAPPPLEPSTGQGSTPPTAAIAAPATAPPAPAPTPKPTPAPTAPPTPVPTVTHTAPPTPVATAVHTAPPPPPTPHPTAPPPPPPTPRPRPAPTPVAASGYHDGTYSGSVVPAGDGFRTFGDVQVQLTVRGGRIISVTELQMPNDTAHSAAISQRAAPQLRQEVLTAQSATIDTVSGATYTSEAYAQSAQAALDQSRA